MKRLHVKWKDEIASIVMFIVPFVASLPLLPPIPSLAACVAGTIVERVNKIGSHYLQDNLTVPIAAAIAYQSVNYILS